VKWDVAFYQSSISLLIQKTPFLIAVHSLALIENNNKIKYLYCTGKTIQTTCIDTGEEQFEQVNSFKYLTLNTWEQW
jgi:hypothetical protein